MIILKKNRKLLFIVGGVVAILVVAILVIVLIIGKSNAQESVDEPLNLEELEINFGKIFSNNENEYIKTLYHIEEEKSGKYRIQADIPCVNTGSAVDNEINKEIYDIFVQKMLSIYNESKTYSIVSINYATSIDDNILSLAIHCVLKEGVNAQRTIVKTYNFNLQDKQLMKITDVVPENKREEIQQQINKKIQVAIKKENTIIEQGYKVYRRNPESSIYILENATEFFVKDGIVYIIYSYGNSSFTSEMDLIIDKIKT